jgi:hypothetical protein
MVGCFYELPTTKTRPLGVDTSLVTRRARARDQRSRLYDATGLLPTYILDYAITGCLPDQRSAFRMPQGALPIICTA